MMRHSATRWLLVIGMAAAAWAQSAPATSQPATGGTDAELQAKLDKMTLDELIAEGTRLCEEVIDYHEAAIYVTAARRRSPNNLDALTLQAEISLGLGDLTSAREVFRAVYGQNPNDFRANLGLGRVYLVSRFWAQAVPYLEKAASVAPPGRTAEAQRLLAECYRGAGKPDRAIEIAEPVAKSNPNDFDVLLTLVSALNQAERFERGATEAEKLQRLAEQQVKANPADAQTLQHLLSATQSFEEAVRGQYLQCVAKSPGGTSLDQVLAGQEAQAAAALHKLVDLLQIEADLQRLMTYHNMLEFGQRLVKLVPDNADYWWQYALLLRETRQPERAIEALRKVLELRPGDAAATRMLAELGASATPPTTAPATPADDSATH